MTWGKRINHVLWFVPDRLQLLRLLGMDYALRKKKFAPEVMTYAATNGFTITTATQADLDEMIHNNPGILFHSPNTKEPGQSPII